MANTNDRPASSTANTPQSTVAGQSNAANSSRRTLAENPQRRGVSPSTGSAPYLPSASDFFANPFAAMRRMHEDMDRFFAQALGGGTAASPTSERGMAM